MAIAHQFKLRAIAFQRNSVIMRVAKELKNLDRLFATLADDTGLCVSPVLLTLSGLKPLRFCGQSKTLATTVKRRLPSHQVARAASLGRAKATEFPASRINFYEIRRSICVFLLKICSQDKRFTSLALFTYRSIPAVGTRQCRVPTS